MGSMKRRTIPSPDLVKHSIDPMDEGTDSDVYRLASEHQRRHFQLQLHRNELRVCHIKTMHDSSLGQMRFNTILASNDKSNK